MLKSEIVPVPTGKGWETNRDSAQRKHFLITEMPAVQAEKWAWRLFLALKGTTGQIPVELIERLGMVGVGIVGLNSFLAAPVKFEDLSPLLDEMLECVQMIRDIRHPEAATKLTPGDLEEVHTIGWLRSEVLRIHTGFSATAFLSTLMTVAEKSVDLQNMSMSPRSSDSLSQ